MHILFKISLMKALVKKFFFTFYLFSRHFFYNLFSLMENKHTKRKIPMLKLERKNKFHLRNWSQINPNKKIFKIHTSKWPKLQMSCIYICRSLYQTKFFQHMFRMFTFINKFSFPKINSFTRFNDFFTLFMKNFMMRLISKS